MNDAFCRTDFLRAAAPRGLTGPGVAPEMACFENKREKTAGKNGNMP